MKDIHNVGIPALSGLEIVVRRGRIVRHRHENGCEWLCMVVQVVALSMAASAELPIPDNKVERRVAEAVCLAP